MKQKTVERGIGLVVLYVPTEMELFPEEWRNYLPADFDRSKVARRLVEICKSEGLACIEPSDRFREAAKQGSLYYLHDGHWNAAGHHLAGKILAEYVESCCRGTSKIN